ncbi:methylenetetrahydrofolate reductase [NAD(P)H] [Candidatus Woesearchaeota archaeon]|nr:MAG: methylenetetrahydrofolate reductase [NAD(P)H] [Candidatus Woesearchaeota archaeon]
MSVIERLKNGPLLSVEIEPPRVGASLNDLFVLLDDLVEKGIHQVNITYHAEQPHTDGIARRKKPGTTGIAGAIIGRYGATLTTVPHVICTGFSAAETQEYLIDLAYLGVTDVLALRGDPYRDAQGRFCAFTPKENGHRYARDLVRQLSDLRQGKYLGGEVGVPLDFCVGAACYPEGHRESPSRTQELRWLKEKVDAGVDYLVTQAFYNNELYYRFVDEARAAGINVPIIPGLFPLTKRHQLSLLQKVFGVQVPRQLAEQIESSSVEDRVLVGSEWTVQQALQLRENGAPGIHLYTHNGAPVSNIITVLQSKNEFHEPHSPTG